MRLVFVGPSLPRAEIPGDVVVLPPARQGDVFRAVRDRRPHAIGIIDGLFQDVPAIWHREILWALSRGVHVLGGASMGALRAAELGGFGMRGVGAVAEAYAAGLLEDDDEVAVTHAPGELGWRPLSDAVVDLRATLDAAVAQGVATPERAAGLVRAMKARAFADRSYAALAAVADGDLGAWLLAHPVRRKQQDARQVVAALRAVPDTPFVPDFRFERSLAWERFVARQAVLSRVAGQRDRDDGSLVPALAWAPAARP